MDPFMFGEKPEHSGDKSEGHGLHCDNGSTGLVQSTPNPLRKLEVNVLSPVYTSLLTRVGIRVKLIRVHVDTPNTDSNPDWLTHIWRWVDPG